MNEALKIIKAKSTGATALDLSGMNLTELPPELFRLENLEVLYLGNNQLKTLPPELFLLANLKELYLSNNRLETLPPELFRLEKLKVLYLGNNPLRKSDEAVELLRKSGVFVYI